MLALQKALKKIIERYIVNMTPLTAAVSVGATTIPIVSSRRYCRGDRVVIYNKPSPNVQASGEVHVITSVPDKRSIVIDDGLVDNYPLANSFVEKIIGFEAGNEQFLEAIYIGQGDIKNIVRFPAITIDAKSRSSEWLTLESISEKFEIDISVHVMAADYESQYELMQTYVTAIEDSLFRSFYPLVEPYDLTTLAEDVQETDTIIRITDETLLTCIGGWIWLESHDYLRENRILEYLGNGVYRLLLPAGKEFSAGDSVIRPRTHYYNTMPHSTRYGSTNSDGGMLKSSVISYFATRERRLYVPFVDPLTF